MLRATASEKMLARLLVLRSGSTEARAAMLSALVREAPDREAAALLAFALGDDTLVSATRRGLPRSPLAWGRALARKFGAAGVEALAWLVERYPDANTDGWLDIAKQLLESGAIKKRDAGPLRDAALATMASGVWDGTPTAPALVARIGPPRVVVEAIWPILVEGERLASLGECVGTDRAAARALDELATATFHDAITAGDRDRACRVVTLAGTTLGRVLGSRAALFDAIEPMLDSLSDDADARTFAIDAVQALRAAGRFDEAWIDAALERPDLERFGVAARMAKRPSCQRALERALTCDAREGASAADAAATLLRWRPRPISKRDPRVLAALRAATPAAAMDLLEVLLARRAATRDVMPALARIFESRDPDDIERALELVTWAWSRPRTMRALVTRVQDETVRRALEEVLCRGDEYWVD
jgi:hypothetical protein